MPWRTLSMDLGGRRAERLHDYALRVQSNVRELAEQGVRLPDARPSARIPCATSSKPEHSSPHCHHDTGGHQLAEKRCEEGVQVLLRRDSCEIRRSTTRTSRRMSVCHRKKMQGSQQRNRKERLTWKPLLRASERGQRHRFGRNRCSKYTAGLRGVTTIAWRKASRPWLRDSVTGAYQWRKSISS